MAGQGDLFKEMTARRINILILRGLALRSSLLFSWTSGGQPLALSLATAGPSDWFANKNLPFFLSFLNFVADS